MPHSIIFFTIAGFDIGKAILAKASMSVDNYRSGNPNKISFFMVQNREI